MDVYDAFICICIGLILAFIFVTKQARDDNGVNNRLERVSGGYQQSVMYDKDMKIMYLCDHRYEYTIIVDKDGKPIVFMKENSK